MSLKRRVDINARDAKGNTQVLSAAGECSMLIEAGCDKHAAGNNSKGAVQQTMRRFVTKHAQKLTRRSQG